MFSRRGAAALTSVLIAVPLLAGCSGSSEDDVTAAKNSNTDTGSKDTPPGHCKVVICHATCSESGGNTGTGYSAIEVPADCADTPAQALTTHLLSGNHHNGCQDGRTDVLPLEVTDDKKLAKCPNGLVVNPLSF